MTVKCWDTLIRDWIVGLNNTFTYKILICLYLQWLVMVKLLIVICWVIIRQNKV